MSVLRSLAAVVACAVLVAGCGGGARSNARSTAASAASTCTTSVAHETALSKVQTQFVRMPGRPVGVVSTPDGSFSFVSLPPRKIALMSDRAFAPKRVRTIPVPASFPAGLTLTHDGRYLLAAGGRGAVVMSVGRAEQGSATPVLGSLLASGRGVPSGSGGAAKVITSNDDRFAFVSLEFDLGVAVFDLRAAIADGFRSSRFVGMIPLGIAPIGLALSPDGQRIYATSEARTGTLGGKPSEGTISVIDLRRAETDPTRSVLASATAGCSPVRVAVSSDGRQVWVTARASDELLAFSASQLLSDPRHALLAAVKVGEAPVGLALVDHGRRIVVGDSNDLGAPGASAGLSIVDTGAALAGKPALLGVVRAGLFPREMSVLRNDKTLLVTNFFSLQLESVNIGQIP